MVVGYLPLNRQQRVLRYITPILAGSIVLVTLVVLAQWIFGSFESVGSSLEWVPMAPLTAILFLLVGTVLLLQRQLHAVRVLSGIIRAVSVFMLLVSSYLVLYNFINALPIDIEGFMAAPTTLASGSIIGRMSPITAILLILVSISFFISTLQRERPDRLLFMTDVLTLGVFVTALVILSGYWYKAPLFYGGTIIPVAITTAISFLLVNTVQLFDKPENLFYRFVTSHSITAQICRRILPLSILIVMAGGYAEEFVSSVIGLGMFPTAHVVLTLAVVAVIILIVSTVSKRIDRDIAQKEVALRSSENSYSQLLEKGNDGIIVIQDGLVKFANSKALEMTGFSQKNDVLGKPLTDFISQQSTELVMDRYKKRLAGEDVPGIYEIEILNKDGSLNPVEVNASMVEYVDKPAVMAMIRSITERKRAGKTLIESEERFRAIFDTTTDGLLIADTESKKFFEGNTTICRMLGYTREEIKTMGIMDIHPEEELASVLEKFEKLAQGDVTLLPDIPVKKKDGSVFYVDINAAPVTFAGKTYQLGIFRDATGRRKAEESLRTSEERLRVGLKTANIAVFNQDRDLRYIWMYQPQLGYTSEQVIGYTDAELLPFEAAKQVMEIKRRVVEGSTKERTEVTVIVDGKTFFYDLLVEPLLNASGAIVGIVGASIDITERKQMTKSLQQSETYLLATLDSTNDGILTVDDSGKIINSNRRFAEMWHISSHMIEQHDDNVLLSYVLEQLVDPEVFVTRVKQLYSVDQRDFDTLRFKDGRVFERYSRPLILNKADSGRVWSFRDVTERERSEAAVRASEERYRTLFESAAEGISAIDLNGVVLEINQHLLNMLGLVSKTEIIGKSAFKFVNPIDHKKTQLNIQKTMEEGKIEGLEVSLLKSDGSKFSVEVNASLLKDGSDRPIGFIAGFRDITDRKQAEEARQTADKLGSIGTLAGGIAHDFNNILTGILGNIQLANGYLKQNKTDTAEEMLDEAEKASLRAKDLTQQLLTFSKGGVPVKKVILVNQLIRESATFALRGSKVRPEFVIPDDLWAVEADKGQLNQVIGNIVINANHAMPNGGIIKVSARNIVTEKQLALPVPDGRYIEVGIEDQGIGIPEGNKSRIFEPYFTTKQKGSGLGLATSYSIIKNHGGYIAFESELGVGTTFHIYLPATEEKVKEERVQLSKQPSQMAQGRILVMDDENDIRTLLGRILKEVGFEVELTADGAEALTKYVKAKKSGKPFRAVILDLTVPGGMGGKELMEELLKIDPNVKAVVSSGYATDPIMAEFKKYGFSGVVTKPYSIRQMQETLHAILTDE